MSRRPAAGADAAASARGPFVGRDGALRALLATVDAAGDGRGTVALVAGEAGIGKTRLLTEVAARVSCPVLWSACWEGEGAPAFWPWVQVLRALPSGPLPAGDGRPAMGTGDLVPSLATLLGMAAVDESGADARFRLFDAVADVLVTAAEERPLLVVVDDLQWADPGSLRLLTFLARDPRTRGLAILAAYRQEATEAGPALADVIGQVVGDGLHLHLDGLAEEEVARLVELLRGGGEVPPAGALHRRSAGNPLFVREFVRLPSGASDRTVPAGVRAIVALRVEQVSVAARQVMTVAAVLGADFEAGVLGEVAGLDPAAVLDALGEARTAGLVVGDAGSRSFSFVHAVVQEVLYDGLGLGERARLHGRAAAVLERRTNRRAVTEIAHHAVHAVAGASDRHAADWAERAADHCVGRLAYEQAVWWYERALALLPAGSDPEQESELLIRRGEASLAAGDVAEAREAFRQAATVARERDDADQLARAALGLGSGPGGFEVPLHDHTQIALLEEALVALGPTPGRLRTAVLARLSVALSSMDEEARRRSLSEAAIAEARELGDPAALGYALAAHCDVIPGPDHCEAREREATEIVESARRLGDRRLELLGLRLRLVARLELGRMAEADEDRARFAGLADELRQPAYRWYPPLWQGTWALLRGDPSEAAACTAIAEEIGAHSYNAFALTTTQRWVIGRYEGRYSETAVDMRDTLGLGPGGTPIVFGPGQTRVRGIIAAQLGDLEQARAHLETLVAAGLDRLPKDSEWLPELAQLAELAVVVGHRDAASQLHELLSPHADLFCVEGIGAAFTGSVAWYLAMLARTMGDVTAAARWQARAAEAHRRVAMVGDPAPLAAHGGSSGETIPVPGGSASLTGEGATWAVTFAGTTRRLRDSKGLRDLAVLLSRPGQEVHCLELAGGSDVGSEAGPLLDDQARLAYQRRIRDLQDDIDEARAANDLVRAERAEFELDALVEQLSQAFGLSGRARRSGAAAERARSTVTSRIRAAIRQAAEVHPELGHHLQHSVRTGTWCAYAPEHPVAWDVERGGGRS